MSTQGTNAQFLAGNILIPVAFPNEWLEALAFIIPMTSGTLEAQLNASVTAINQVLATYPQPNIDTELIIMPINVVNNLKNALEVFQTNFNGVANYDPYYAMYDNVENVYNVYSSCYYNSPLAPYYVY